MLTSLSILAALSSFPPSGWWVLAALVGVAAGIAFERRRLNRALEHSAELEEEVREGKAELDDQQKLLERQNKRLEVNNNIIKFVNARIGFSDLLQTILEAVLFVLSSDRALALAADEGGEHFAVRAASGWRFGEPRDLSLDRGQIEETYLAGARQVAPGIWVGPPSTSPLLAEEERLGAAAAAVLVMRVEVEEKVAGYLVIHHLRDADAFDHEDVEGLEDLKEHMASAFLKGRMMEQLRELNEKKNEFLGMAAHDLRNPLTGVLGFTDILLTFLDEKRFESGLWRRFLQNIQILSEDMCTMVNQLLDVAAIEAGKVELHIESNELASFLDQRSELHAQTAQEKGIELQFDTSSAAVDVLMDRIRISEVVDNLVSNAIKFTWPGGRVRVFCEKSNGEIVTHVEDTGQGLEQEEVDEAFSGRKLSARPTGGESSTGLGLVIVKKIVEMHRGRTWVESVKGEGSKFSFSLPRPSVEGP